MTCAVCGSAALAAERCGPCLVKEREEARAVARQKHREHRFYFQDPHGPGFPGWTLADLTGDERRYPWLTEPGDE